MSTDGYQYRIVCADGECDDDPRDVRPTRAEINDWDEQCVCGGPHTIEGRSLGEWEASR